MALAGDSLTAPAAELPSDPTHLGQLAIAAGLIEPEALAALRAQARRLEQPLGAALVASGAIDARQLGELLAEQQRRRHQPGPAAPRLTEQEHRLLGLWLVHEGLVDVETLVACREHQAQALRAGRHRLLGEVVLERELIPAGRMESMLACLAHPGDIERRFNHEPQRRRLLELYLAPPELESSEARYALEVASAPTPEDVGRTHPLPSDGAPLLVGRGVDPGIDLNDETLSTPHCHLRLLEDGDLEVIDLGSVNGCFVNGHRLTEPSRLRAGEELVIGRSRLRFLDAGSRVSSSSSDSVESVVSELAELEELEVIDLAAPAAEGEEPIAIAGARSVFREFHARMTQLERLRDEPTAHAAAPQPAGPAPPALTARPAVSAKARRVATQQARWPGLVFAGLALLAVVGLGALVALSWPGARRRQPPASELERLLPDAGAARAAADQPPAALGSRLRVRGTSVGWRWLQAGDQALFCGALRQADGELLFVQGPAAALGELVSEDRSRPPFGDGAQLELSGTLRAFDGPPAILPGGRRARFYLEVSSAR